MRSRLSFSVAAIALGACTPHTQPVAFTIFVGSDATPAVSSFFDFLPEANAKVVASADPAGDVAAGHGTGVRVALVADLTCGECYSLSGSAWRYQVHGGGTLALQYGLAELLEALDFRFFHPWATKVPSVLTLPDGSSAFGHTFAPQMSLRGLHLHTLHPIESYYAFWEPAADDTTDARRINDWIIKNRGNYVEWAALGNIETTGPIQDDWHMRTQAIIEDAHQRGMQIGMGTELFSTGNLQGSFVLLDEEQDPNAELDVDARLAILLNAGAWDFIDLSFGEFASAEPSVFIDAVNLTYQELQKLAPGTPLAATIHVDNSPDLVETYEGQQVPYYFLVQFCNPQIISWIHTVMYYDMFQSAGGAYGYQTFNDHLVYMENQLKAGHTAGYFPESAYWVAFDDSVPTYLPVYMRSRWVDMSQIQAAATQGGFSPPSQHVEFSSGWEWGYWQNDYATLRMNFGLPSSWDVPVQEMFAPWGTQGQQLAAQIKALGELQSSYLIDQQLGAYLAGQDAVIDIGAQDGVVSQPPRPSFAAVAAMSSDDLASFVQTVLTPLTALQTGTEQIQAAIAALKLDPSDPWLSETSDGIDVDAARTEFITALYQATVSFAMQGSDGGWLAKANTALANGQTIISRRHANLHYPQPDLLTQEVVNDTIYQYGYLMEADTLCYWQRELIQAQAVILGDTTTPVPPCVLQ